MEDDEYARALDLVQRARETYGTAEVAASGIDISQLRRNRRLSPTERIDQMVTAAGILVELQGKLAVQRPSDEFKLAELRELLALEIEEGSSLTDLRPKHP